ncbi:hypothetical protein AVEN_15598-1 [Araneus ventricosus]|uniref:Tc1-like transposase DDE domain-containing protein n=1 Tax=Araneus ventricosus TaxID=182803 RepID=A0A4Y2M837_ARAVE|nr:hypothetical protein AVEN_15598-1 [Araneus ventricosus]
MNSRSFPSPRKPLWKIRFTTQTPSLTLARPKIRLARIEPTKPAGAGTINAARYFDTLTKLMSVIPPKRLGLLSRGVLFLDDNARSNTATDTKEHIRRQGWGK